jgi:hypothetical protein
MAEQNADKATQVPPSGARPADSGAPAEAGAPVVAPPILERLDLVLVAFLLALAFLVGSFAASNSDVWLYLASGRHIAHGEWTIGVDPFSFATEATPGRSAVFWVQPTWLSSWLFYVLYNLVGGGGLVLVKALAVVALTWCLLQIPGGRRERFLSVIYVGMALLALSPHLLLRPMMVSFLFYAVTLLICYRAGALGNVPAQPRLLWWLVPLFLLWANLDVWFIIGPLTLLLLWAGVGFGAALGIPRSFPGTTLGAVLGVGVLACLVNPHHVRVFQLPPELANVLVQAFDLPDALGAGGRAVRSLQAADPDSFPLLSPLSGRHWGNSAPGGGRNIGAMAYYPLLALGLISFVINAVVTKKPGAPGLHPGRFLLWAVLAALSVMQVRLIPWFAIASAPLTMLNLVDWRTWLTNIEVPNWRPALLGRGLTLFLLIILLFLAWPGWLYAPPGDFASARHVAWSMSPDSSLKTAALYLEEWSKKKGQGQARAEPLRVFNFSADIAHYCAWYAPGVKCFLDSRWPLFADDAALAAKARQGLAVGEPEAWQPVFQERRVDCLALVPAYSAQFQRRRELEVVDRLWRDETHWAQQYADGWTCVFTWSGPGKTLSPMLPSQILRQAFGAVPESERAPPHGPKSPEERSLVSEYWEGPQALPLTYYEGYLWLHYYKAMGSAWWSVYPIASQVARAAEPAGLGHYSVTVPYLLGNFKAIPSTVYFKSYPSGNVVLKARDAGPVAAPLVAIRRARQAVAADPTDARIYALLAEAYAALAHLEDHWANYQGDPRRLGRRYAVRQIQRMTALQTYLALKPEDPQVNEMVGRIFLQMKLYDVALEHLQKAADFLGQVAPSAGTTQELETLKKHKNDFLRFVKNLQDEVNKRREDYEKAAAFGSKKGLEKCPLAMQRGLPNEAVDLLTKMNVEGLSPEEKKMREYLLVDLLLMLGRANYLEEGMIDPGQGEFRIFHAAARGNYADLDKIMEQAVKSFAEEKTRALPRSALYAAELCVPGWLRADPAALAIQAYYYLYRDQISTRMIAQPEAEIRTLRGVLALEGGATSEARGHFASALQTAGADYFLDRPVAERYLEFLRKEEASRK